MHRLALTSFALVFAGLGLADSDYLDRVKRQNEVAAQRMEETVRAALQSAQALETKEPGKAVDTLKKALAELESDSALNKTRRETLTRILNNRIKATQAQAKETPKDRKKPGPKGQTDEDTIKKMLQVVNDLRKEGKVGEASAVARQMAKTYPDSPSAQAAARTMMAAEMLASAKDSREAKDRNYRLKMQKEYDRLMTIPLNDIEYPADWAEKTRKAKKVNLTPKEETILKVLNSRVNANFDKDGLTDALDFLSTLTGTEIVVDKQALEDANISSESKVTFNAKNVTVRTTLRALLAQVGLTYVVKNETIMIVSPQAAKEMLVTRSYPIGDLVMPVLGAFDPRAGNPWAQEWLAAVNAEQLINMIVNSIDPPSWKANGGHGTIEYNPATKSITVRQSAEFHTTLGGTLGRK